MDATLKINSYAKINYRATTNLEFKNAILKIETLILNKMKIFSLNLWWQTFFTKHLIDLAVNGLRKDFNQQNIAFLKVII